MKSSHFVLIKLLIITLFFFQLTGCDGGSSSSSGGAARSGRAPCYIGAALSGRGGSGSLSG